MEQVKNKIKSRSPNSEEMNIVTRVRKDWRRSIKKQGLRVSLGQAGEVTYCVYIGRNGKAPGSDSLMLRDG